MQSLIENRRRGTDKCQTEPQLVKKTLSAVGSALLYIHAEGVLHRDVKPSNILLDRDMREIRLADFGVSKILQATARARSFVGTPYYLSPEIVSGQPYGASSDTWALGVCLYELLALRRPFEAENQLALACQIAHEEPAPLPADHVPDVVQAIMGLLRKDPGERMQLTEALALSDEVAQDKTDASSERATNQMKFDKEASASSRVPKAQLAVPEPPLANRDFSLKVVLPSSPCQAHKQKLMFVFDMCKGKKCFKERKSHSGSRGRPRWPKLRLRFRSRKACRVYPVTVEPVTCPGGHILDRVPAPCDMLTCDACGQTVASGSIVWGCRTCDYDLCSFCSCGEAPWMLSEADESDDAPLIMH